MESAGAAFASVLRGASQAARELNPPTPEDYEVKRNGRWVLICHICGEPKARAITRIDPRTGGTKESRVGCECGCGRKRMAAERERDTERIRRNIRERGHIMNCAFEMSQRDPDIDKCWHYAQKWDEMRKRNIGLLLWGGNGPGKSHAAHCIANALIDRTPPVSVYTQTFAAILQGKFDKTEILDAVYQSSLVIFEDLGAERGNDYAFETVFAIVDERYRARKPTIVTTNLTWREVQDPRDERGIPDMRRKRIYDRIVEMCVPIEFHGASRRDSINAAKKDFARQALGL